MPALTVYKSRFLKADRRTVIQTADSQTYRTTFEQQARFDDIFMLPGTSLRPDTAGLTGQLLVLPIVGGALLTTVQETDRALLPGCIYTIPAADARSFTLTNPFEQETVNLLLLQAPVPTAISDTVQEFLLPLTTKNVLITTENQALPARVGLYDSRVKDTIPTSNPSSFSLCYVINGSFEIEDRLVEHRDALLFWETPEIDFEALSETAILFCLEFAGVLPGPG